MSDEKKERKAKHYVKVEIAENGFIVTHANSGYDYDKKKEIHHPLNETILDLIHRIVPDENITETLIDMMQFFILKSSEAVKAEKEVPTTDKADSTCDLDLN